MQYVRMRVLCPEDIELDNAAGTIRVNRFQLLGRLFQVYLVDMWSRIVDQRLEWIRRNQHLFLGDNTLEIHQDNTNEEEGRQQVDQLQDQQIEVDPNTETAVDADIAMDERRVFLPSSFTGSPRHYRTLCANALTLWARKGKPTFFITATTNPYWTEITRELCPGQKAYDRPDVTCRVFAAKMAMLLDAIRGGFIFGEPHEIVYSLRVVEYQKRGLPHMHMIFQLANVPEDPNELVAWVNQHITAELPVHLSTSEDPDEQRYLNLVKSHMVHKCRRGENGCLSRIDGQDVCRSRFPQPLAEESYIDHRGYMHYRRR